ncbi:MAG TPA: ribonuclease HII [Candidatus Omnitrophota bacterium]|nr:ribonuclease HII [Candidatus Omnitrophota bacterium]HPS36544.1 ribonuclease HII [Candidatus Omnitrophota bacterium]
MALRPKDLRKAQLLEKLREFDRGETRGREGWMAGVDEAGRGPLAGPVVAAAVIVFRPEDLSGVNDSKKLSASQREKLCGVIARSALVGIGIADERMIDEINIYEATRLAMKKAVLNLTRTPDLLLIDGPMRIDLPLEQKGVIRGDQKSASIAAASIIAKVFRDRWMHKLHEIYPAYAFHNHKGYGTAEHLKALREVGPSPVHRRSFAPVREALQGAVL